MLKLPSSFKEINKILLLVTLISLASNLEKGSFSRHFIPSPFQILLVISIALTAIYVLKNHQVKNFFLSVPKKILLAIGSFFFSIFLGWVIAIFFLEIQTTIHTILDFGTFMMGMILFLLVSFYAKNDEKYAKWYLYALLIPNFHLLYYFFSHGIVGYWGVPNDYSLDYVLDPNILSKTLLVPALFFISTSIYALKNKNWRTMVGYIVAASIFSMLVFWTVSRGSILSLVVGIILVWLVFSVREFTWKKFFLGGVIILAILSLGYMMLPNNTKQAISVKIAKNMTLPVPTNYKTSNIANTTNKTPYVVKIFNIPNITKNDIKENSRIDLRYLIWYYYPKYILQHPFGVGPNSSWDFGFRDRDGAHFYFGPDSTYLVVGLWGGLLGIMSYLYILYNAFVWLRKRWKRIPDVISLALLGILFTLSVALFFDGILSLYWFYVILALSLQKNETADYQIAKPFVKAEKMSDKQKKLVSVIIPAYNTEKYISQNIKSVIYQTYNNIEIIIVNDGSTDGTGKIIQEYSKKDKRIIIINQPNKGVSAARNSGFKIAKGEYFCIIDADDIMMPEKIESQLKFLEDNISADFTYSKVYYFIDGINDVYVRNLATVSGSRVYKKLLENGNFIYTGTVFFRRNVFDKFGGFDESLRSAEEFDYWLSLSRRGVNFLHQDKYLTLCRSRKDGLTSDSGTMYTACITVFEKYINISGNKFSAYIKYPQYFKSKLLLYFLTLKKPKSKNKSVLESHANLLNFSYHVNQVFALLKKIKFLLTFKKVKDKKVKNYLTLIESYKNTKI